MRLRLISRFWKTKDYESAIRALETTGNLVFSVYGATLGFIIP